MRIILVFIAAVGGVWGQTTIYLRDGPPGAAIPAIQVCNATNATPMQITTCTPTGAYKLVPSAHNFPSGCGTTQTCYADIAGVVSDGNTGTCPTTVGLYAAANSADGIRAVKWINSYTLELYDLNGVSSSVHLGNPIASTGNYCAGSNWSSPFGASWVGQVSPYTLPATAKPGGWLDGQYGNLMRKLALSTQNGLTALTVSGCPSACVISVSTAGASPAYDPTAASLPVTSGTNFAVFGTNTTLDSTNASSCAGSGSAAYPLPYTVGTVSSSGWSSSPFTCSSLTNGTYTNSQTTCGPAPTPNDTIGGSQSCTVVSQIAYHGNQMWDTLARFRSNQALDDSSNNYKAVFDGGTWYTAPWPSQATAPYAAAGLAFLVDRSNSLLFRDLQYGFNEIEMSGGVSWVEDELTGFPSSNEQQDGNYGALYNSAMILDVYGPYASPANLTKFLNKHYNNIDDPSNQCTKQGVEPSTSTGMYAVVASGASTSAPTSSTLPVQSCSGIAAGEIVALGSPVGTAASTGVYGTIASCSSSTVNLSGGWQGGSAPSSATPYWVFAVAQWSTTTSGASATVTLTGTTTTAMGIQVGDAVAPGNTWGHGMGYIEEVFCKVTALGGSPNNTLTCLNSGYVPSAAASAPQMVWRLPAINVSSTSTTSNVGTCGRLWGMAHWPGQFGAQPGLYPPNGGANTTNGAGAPTYTSNQQTWVAVGRMALDFAAAPYDARAVRDLAIFQGQTFDYSIAPYLAYSTGWLNDGAQYSNGVAEGLGLYTWLVMQNVPTFPSLYPTGPWLSNMSQYAMYTLLPDFLSNGNPTQGQPVCWGAVCSNSYLAPGSASASSQAYNAELFFAPNASTTQYFVNWATNVLGSGSSMFSRLPTSQVFVGPLLFDPRTVATNSYTVQPRQYLFAATNYANVAAATGWGAPESNSNVSGLGFVSRTTFGNYTPNNGNTCQTSACLGTFLLHRQAGFISDHDNFGLETHLYKYGKLIANDGYANTGGGGGFDMSINGSAVQFGGAQSQGGNEFNYSETASPDRPSGTVLVRWSSANHGSWPAAYGDQASTYAHFCADSAPSYRADTSYNWHVTSALRCVTDFKYSGWDQFVVEQDEAFATSPEPIQRAIHYAQNGCTSSTCSNPPWDQTYQDGTTFCVNSSNVQVPCSSLNSYGRIESVEDGTSGRVYGVMTQIYSPNTVTLTWACPGSGNAPQCSPTSTYSGGYGYSDPVIISAGSSATKLEDVVVHKIMNSLTDTTLKTVPLSAGGWTGAEGCGALSCFAYFAIRGSGASATVPGFSTTISSSLPYQYLISGVSAGTYTVTVGGQAVPGSPFTVGSGDSSIEFNIGSGTVSGVVSINGSALPCTITTASLPGGTAGAAYSQTLATSNCTAPVTWSVTSGTLCTGLTLGPSTGTIAGTPSSAQTCSFTVQAADAGSNLSSQALSIVIGGASVPPGATTSSIGGNASVGGNVIIH